MSVAIPKMNNPMVENMMMGFSVIEVVRPCKWSIL